MDFSSDIKCVNHLGLDGLGKQPPAIMSLQHCFATAMSQLMRLNAAGQLGVGERCVEADEEGIKLTVCHLGTVDGPWKYDENSKTLLHRVHKKCMTSTSQLHQVILMPCDNKNIHHQWNFVPIGH